MRIYTQYERVKVATNTINGRRKEKGDWLSNWRMYLKLFRETGKANAV